MIYVDPIREYVADVIKPGARRFGKRWCHLSDSENDVERLCGFAERIGLRRSWLQGSGPRMLYPHFDLTPRLRHKAILAGAVEITHPQAADMWAQEARERRQFPKGSPYYGVKVDATGTRRGVMGTRRVRRTGGDAARGPGSQMELPGMAVSEGASAGTGQGIRRAGDGAVR